MRSFWGKSALGALLSLGIYETLAQTGYVAPAGSPGFYHGSSSAAVTFDQYSLFLGNNRTLFLSGEFHPFRLPSPDLWLDILQKFKASGLNAVSVYWHWGLTSPKEGVNRFTGHNDIAKFLQVAQDVGLLVIVRPGPYINAESAGGGLPNWLSNVPVRARTNATAYKEAWTPYITEFAQLCAPFQYPNGPLIGIQAENEFGTSAQYGIPGLDEYMQDLIDTIRASGLDKIPTTFNDNWPKGTFANPGLGQVDLYGWDGYPMGFDCSRPDVWTSELDVSLHANHMNLAPYVPLALFEWQGGAFDYWGSNIGYDKCYLLTNEVFANVYYKNNYAGGAKLQSLYMTYGGTCWGNLGNEGIYTSYDYGAAIREDRTITQKLKEIKVQSYFLHASPAYMTADWIGAGSTATGTAFSNSSDIYTTLQHDSASGTNFYFVRQATVNKTTITDYTLRVNSTTLGNGVTVPLSGGTLTLNGRESKILVTDYNFGSSKLVFSTAEVLTWQTFDGVDYLYLYASPNESVEIILGSSSSHHRRDTASTSSSFTAPTGFTVNTTSSYTAIRSPGNRASTISVVSNNKVVLIIADKTIAYETWAPRFQPSSGFGHYTPTSNVPGVWILGPHLVRNATLQGNTLAIQGDLNVTSTIDIWGPSSIQKVTWNGKSVSVSNNSKLRSLHGSIQLDVSANSISVPNLSQASWKYLDSIPEADPNYDDSTWTVANKTSTARPQQPYEGKYVLYGEEYGYYVGQLVWRGQFTGNATGVDLIVQTGFSGAFTAFLNGHFLGSVQGSSTEWSGVDPQIGNFTFTPDMLRSGKNVVVVYHDSTGMSADYNVDDQFKEPRGVRGYKLHSTNGNDFTKWTVAGNYGGPNAPDSVRGPYNEGGWYYERIGAHLPGFDDSSWRSGSPLQGRTTPGITAYRTKFNLNIPAKADVPLSIDLQLDSQAYRAVIYVNGWQYGRFASTLGPQTSYPVPEGIFNHQGENEVLIALWALNGAAKLKSITLTKRAVLSSSKASNIGLVDAPSWSALRSQH